MKEETIFKGKEFNLLVRTYPWKGKTLQREIIDHPEAVVILPLGTEKIYLIKQLRRAVNEHLYELPAGTKEKGETLLECAKRELNEETGFTAKKWEKLCAAYPAPGYSTELLHFFLARDLSSQQPNLEFGETIQVTPQPIPQVKEMMLTNKIRDQKTLLALLWLFFTNPQLLEKREL